MPATSSAATWDKDAELRSLQWLHGLAHDPACAAMLAAHDPEVAPGVIEL